MDFKTLIDKIAERTDIPTQEVVRLNSALADALANILMEGDSVAIPAFGNFESKKRMERISVHPASGKRLLVPPKIVASFKPSAILKSRLKDE